MIRVALCDDTAADRIHLRSLLKNCAFPLEITEYSSGDELIWDVETEKVRFDIYLLDIYLTGISGVETAQRLRAVDDRALLIFTSTSEEFYREAFDVYALNYLVKPVEQGALDTAMRKAADELERQREKVLIISSRGRTQILRHDDIEYISSANHSLCFHMRGGEEHSSYGKLDTIAEQLTVDSFVRCHQSYIVNLLHVTGHAPKKFYIRDVTIPVSRSYAVQAQEALNRYLFGIFEKN